MSVKNFLESHMLTHSDRSSRKKILIDPVLWNIVMLLCSCKLIWKIFETYFVHTRIVNKLVVGLRVTAMFILCEEVKLNYLYFNKRFSIKKLEPKYIEKTKETGTFLFILFPQQIKCCNTTVKVFIKGNIPAS